MWKFAASLLMAICAFSSSLSMADTRYVTDELKITLRRGESTEHKVVKMLPSGSKVEVLSASAETNYSKVRTADGTEGYVLSRMLKQDRPARDKLAAVEKKLQALLANPDTLRSDLSETKQELAQVNSAYEALRQENQKLGTELASLREISATSIETAKQRDKLKLENTALAAQVGELSQFKQNLQNDEFRRWFLVGAAVLLVGMLLGLIAPRLRQNRSGGFGSY